MAAQGNNVRFIQFNGTLNEWNGMIHNSDNPWFNAVVFGYIYDEVNDKVINKIYAGKDTYGVDYIFDFDKDVCRWNYGDVSQGWHDASTYITNKVGQITTDMTLGDLISATNGGNLSRIIEMMLFKQAGPQIITFTAMPKSGCEKHAITVSFKALNADECYMKITDNNGKVILDSSISSIYTQDFVQLVPDMKYTVFADAKNGDDSASLTTEVTTYRASQPTISFNEITCTPKENTNYYTITDINLNIMYNDYGIDSVSTWKLGTYEGITLDDLMTKELRYGESYDIINHYKGKCIYQYPGESGKYVYFDSDTSAAFIPLPTGYDIMITKVNNIPVSESTPYVAVDIPSFDVEYTVRPRIYSGSVDMMVDGSVYNTSDGLIENTYTYTYNFGDKDTGDYNINASLYDEYGYCCNSNIVTIRYEAVAPEITKFDINTYRNTNTIDASIDLTAINKRSMTIKITDTDNSRVIVNDMPVTSIPYIASGLILDTNYEYVATAINGTKMDTSIKTYKTPAAIDAVVTIEGITVSATDTTFAVNDLTLNYVGNDYNLDMSYYNAYNVTDGTLICEHVSKIQFINDCSMLLNGKSYEFSVTCDTSCIYHYSDIAPETKEIESNVYQYDAPASIEFWYSRISHSSKAFYTNIVPGLDEYISVYGEGIPIIDNTKDPSVLVNSVLDPSYDMEGQITPGLLIDFIDRAKDIPYENVKTFDTYIDPDGKLYYKYVFPVTSVNVSQIMLIPAGHSAELWNSNTARTAPQTQIDFSKSNNMMTVNGKQYYVWFHNAWRGSLSTGSTYFFHLN
ncbi:MAG: hypothetical protein [Wendovervirus sonii]|uniref:Uncharacterized protein n=1 Tax=phage Lak_Megaphage_Sonny TaxID=3109229 RepID=A0ABZ0Z3Q2_9CAUD|nr:MAG: hypothetical protein [phage Lak_Megaphage_Sonny]